MRPPHTSINPTPKAQRHSPDTFRTNWAIRTISGPSGRGPGQFPGHPDQPGHPDNFRTISGPSGPTGPTGPSGCGPGQFPDHPDQPDHPDNFRTISGPSGPTGPSGPSGRGPDNFRTNRTNRTNRTIRTNRAIRTRPQDGHYSNLRRWINRYLQRVQGFYRRSGRPNQFSKTGGYLYPANVGKDPVQSETERNRNPPLRNGGH